MPSYVEFIPDTIVHTDVLAKDKKEFTNRSISNYRQYTGDMSRITVRARVEAEHIGRFPRMGRPCRWKLFRRLL